MPMRPVCPELFLEQGRRHPDRPLTGSVAYFDHCGHPLFLTVPNGPQRSGEGIPPRADGPYGGERRMATLAVTGTPVRRKVTPMSHQAAIVVGLGDARADIPELSWAAREAALRNRPLHIVR